MGEQSNHDTLAPTPALARRRYRTLLAYDGTLFHGWQKQEPPGQPALRTVAGVVEQAVSLTLQQPISLVGSSRTDAGVHARGQVAQFDAATRIPVDRLAEAIGSRLPRDVDVLAVEPAPPDFDCIKQTTAKQYRYRIFNSTRRPLEWRSYAWHCWWKLDVAAMNDAAGRLLGTHDVAGLAAADHGRESTVRTIFECRVERRAIEANRALPWDDGGTAMPAKADLLPGCAIPAVPEDPHPNPLPQKGEGAEQDILPHTHGPEGTSLVDIVISGNGFLYNMVRIIAGTLVEVGRGHLPPDVIDRILESRDRRLAGPTLPPQGLWLEWIRYGGRP